MLRKYKSHFSTKGFTLVEFLAVFSIIAVLSTISLASFSSYNNSQIFQTSTSEVVSLLNVAKSRAITQVKPPACSTQPLRGYQVVFTLPGPNYRLEVVCGATPVVVSAKKLGQGVTIATGSTATVFFAVSSGTAAPGMVQLNGYSKTTRITIDSTGNISVQ